MEPITAEEVRKAVYDAFKDVTKGEGIGVREANAIDDWADAETQAKARADDIEQHWWDIPPQWQEGLPESFSYVDTADFRFLLPAALTAATDANKRKKDIAHSIFFKLCIHPHTSVPMPHHGHKEYADYLRQVSPQKIAHNYGFDAAQVHAIALYFLWWMQQTESYLYEKDPEHWLQTLRKVNASYREHVQLSNYNLDPEDEINNYNEECRILRDWLILGGVPVPQ